MKISIQDTSALTNFRKKYNGRYLLEMAQRSNEIVLVNWAIGVGKSTCMDDAIEAAIRSENFDLIVVLAPQRQIIEERRLITADRSNPHVLNFRPRPGNHCGKEKDMTWRSIESKGLGVLGRKMICGQCDHLGDCYWPNQLKENIGKCQVVFATQTHLDNNPYFLKNLTELAKARNSLTIFDEINFTLRSYRKGFTTVQLENFITTLQGNHGAGVSIINSEWVKFCKNLLDASCDDLRSPGWYSPLVIREWLLTIQEHGYMLFGEKFCCLTYSIQQMCSSPLPSREKRDGIYSYANVPLIQGSCIVFSGSADCELLSYRLQQTVASPFASYTFRHAETVWHNISSLIGAKKNFRKNSPQILDFFSQLLIKRITSGKKCILITSKNLLNFCINEMHTFFKKYNFLAVVRKGDDLSIPRLPDEAVIPIITYGQVGTNRYEEYDCAYCLNGYYVPENAVNEVLQDLLASDYAIPLRIGIEGIPYRRTATVKNPTDKEYDINHLAQKALDQVELECVFQTVGRVRPFTKPREIITFQCGGPRQGFYDHEHHNLSSIRKHFNLQTRRARATNASVSSVQLLKGQGYSQAKVAEKLALHIRTVKRHWNKPV